MTLKLIVKCSNLLLPDFTRGTLSCFKINASLEVGILAIGWGLWAVGNKGWVQLLPRELTLEGSRLSRASKSARAALCLACFFELPDPEAVLPATDAYKYKE